ncbi:hypothetical protein APHAL10511_004287 [Amanita phalloides]|nr:hypothetical protein APHAL10511_004287 [Amanita phalloides]
MAGTQPDTLELARFREKWKAEVQSRKKAADDSSTQSGSSPPARVHPLAFAPKHLDSKLERGSAGAVSIGKVHANMTAPSETLLSALQAYRDAIQREQNGELDDALVLYRQAFRMDPHVDRAYSREEKLAAVLASQQPLAMTRKEGTDTLTKDFSTSLKVSVSTGSTNKQITVTGILAHIISNFRSDLTFMQEDEKQPLWLRLLPDELLVSILRRLDITSIERFALSCRKARILSLDATIWRELVVATYKPPQISQTDLLTNLMERYKYNYRHLYIEQPRIRLDGVYIAICHYVRAGLSENHWVNISHLITYNRFLRFFSNGLVLSLLANGEMSPQQVIPLLKPTLRMKGLHIGTWQLLGSAVQLNLVDANGVLPASLPPSFAPLLSLLDSLESEVQHSRKHVSHNHAHVAAEQRTQYMFSMILELRSRPLGRWNRLDIASYDSVNLETGDTLPVALKNERPFWFSRVRSYHA